MKSTTKVPGADGQKIEAWELGIKQLEEQLEKATKTYEEIDKKRRDKGDELKASQNKEVALESTKKRLQSEYDLQREQFDERQRQLDEEVRQKKMSFESQDDIEKENRFIDSLKDKPLEEIKKQRANMAEQFNAANAGYEEAKKGDDLQEIEIRREHVKRLQSYLDKLDKMEEEKKKQLELEKDKTKRLEDQKKQLEKQKQDLETNAKNEADIKAANDRLKAAKDEQARLLAQQQNFIQDGGGQNAWNGGAVGGRWGDYKKGERGRQRDQRRQMERDIKNVMRGGDEAAKIIAADMTDAQRKKYEDELKKLGDPKKSDSKFVKDRRKAIQDLLNNDKAAQIQKQQKDAEALKERQNAEKRTKALEEIVKKMKELGL